MTAEDVLRNLVSKVSPEYRFMEVASLFVAHAEWVKIVDDARAVLGITADESTKPE